MEREGILPTFCFSFAKLAVRLTKRSWRREVQKLMNVMFGASFGAKELRRHVERVEGCQRLTTERTHDELSREKFLKDKMRRTGDGYNASAVLYKKIILNVLRERKLSTASDSFLLRSEDVTAEIAQPI